MEWFVIVELRLASLTGGTSCFQVSCPGRVVSLLENQIEVQNRYTVFLQLWYLTCSLLGKLVHANRVKWSTITNMHS